MFLNKLGWWQPSFSRTLNGKLGDVEFIATLWMLGGEIIICNSSVVFTNFPFTSKSRGNSWRKPLEFVNVDSNIFRLKSVACLGIRFGDQVWSMLLGCFVANVKVDKYIDKSIGHYNPHPTAGCFFKHEVKVKIVYLHILPPTSLYLRNSICSSGQLGGRGGKMYVFWYLQVFPSFEFSFLSSSAPYVNVLV